MIMELTTTEWMLGLTILNTAMLVYLIAFLAINLQRFVDTYDRNTSYIEAMLVNTQDKVESVLWKLD